MSSMHDHDKRIAESLANDNIPTNAIGVLLLNKFRDMTSKRDDFDLDINAREWKDMCEEFNKLQETKTNKIPRSLFENRYSIFFNSENINTFGRRSITADAWRERSMEFIRLIDPYRPFQVVDDYDSSIVLKTFPPIFREVDTLNTKAYVDKNDPTAPRDEEGNIIDTNYINSVVNNIFDKFGNHQLRSKRIEGAKILQQCLLGAQDEQRAIADAIITQNIIEHFNDDQKKEETVQEKKDEDPSMDDCGIDFE